MSSLAVNMKHKKEEKCEKDRKYISFRSQQCFICIYIRTLYKQQNSNLSLSLSHSLHRLKQVSVAYRSGFHYVFQSTVFSDASTLDMQDEHINNLLSHQLNMANVSQQ